VATADRRPVIVAGAGPVGLVAALVLAEASVPVVLLEKRDTLNLVSKASTFHPPTLDILARFGVMDEIERIGQRVPFIQYRQKERGIVAEFDLARLIDDTEFPFRIHLEQSLVMPLLLAKLQTMRDVEIRFGEEVVGVETRADSVVVESRSRDGVARRETSYLLGADGVRSAVRAAVGIDFPGSDYGQRVLRIFTRIDLDFLFRGIRPLTYLYTSNESISFLKMPELWRIITRVPGDLSDEEAMSADFYRPQIERFIGEKTAWLADLWSDIYTVGKRVASRYREGRVLLMGDAAHISTVRGGMNLNCGIHDAFAIARAVVDAIESDDPSAVYAAAAERQRIAQEILIPRTDGIVADPKAWLDYAERCAADEARHLAFVRENTMIDMAPAGIRHRHARSSSRTPA
jgi:2-polyprenyl-6-methoxyphenol hydroxylase-like FAD-dependent oxidoreductase